MQWTRSSARVWYVLLAALPGSLGAQTPGAESGKAAQRKSDGLVAVAEVSARRQGAFKVGDGNWTCKGTRCSAGASALAGIAACQNLAREVGRIQSFMVASAALSAEDLQQCNSAAAMAEPAGADANPRELPMKTAPLPDTTSIAGRQSKRLITEKDFTPLARPLPKAPDRARVLPRTPSTNTPAAPPASGPFVPLAIRTSALTLTGTGISEVVFRFTPVAVRTPMMTLTGTGIAETVYRFTPVVVRTPPLTLTGTGRVE